jgi:hypothetical protein
MGEAVGFKATELIPQLDDVATEDLEGAVKGIGWKRVNDKIGLWTLREGTIHLKSVTGCVGIDGAIPQHLIPPEARLVHSSKWVEGASGDGLLVRGEWRTTIRWREGSVELCFLVYAAPNRKYGLMGESAMRKLNIVEIPGRGIWMVPKTMPTDWH